MRDAQLTDDAKLRLLERSQRRQLRYLGFPPEPDASLEQLLRQHKGAVAHLMRPGGRR